MKLGSSASVAGVRLVACDVLDSTNAEALLLARKGERGPLWISAARQTAGRGRRGREWISPPGNLYATLLLTAPAPVERWPELSFVAALAAHDAIIEIAPRLGRHLAVKWPNDLLLGDTKLAGILLEGECEANAVAIGIGVNCTSHPEDVDRPATDLACAGQSILPEQLLGALAAKMFARLAQWNAGRGFSTIRRDWLARARGRGQTVRVRLADGEATGCFEALDQRGALVLRMSDGSSRRIAAGDVSIVMASSAAR